MHPDADIGIAYAEIVHRREKQQMQRGLRGSDVNGPAPFRAGIAKLLLRFKKMPAGRRRMDIQAFPVPGQADPPRIKRRFPNCDSS